MIQVSASAGATEDLGQDLAARVAGGDLIVLEGDLAAGKTTFVRGLLRGLGGDPDQVSSPTFVIVQSYPCHAASVLRLHHVDLYRLADSPVALVEIGIEELLSEADAVVAVEWPKGRIIDLLPADGRLWRVHLEILDDDSRRLEISAPQR